MQPKHRLRKRRIGGKIKIGTIIAICIILNQYAFIPPLKQMTTLFVSFISHTKSLYCLFKFARLALSSALTYIKIVEKCGLFQKIK